MERHYPTNDYGDDDELFDTRDFYIDSPEPLPREEWTESEAYSEDEASSSLQVGRLTEVVDIRCPSNKDTRCLFSR